MASMFYTDWLEIGERQYEYAGDYPIVRAAESDAHRWEPPPNASPYFGYVAVYANPLRNSNTGIEANSGGMGTFEITNGLEEAVEQLYAHETAIVVQTREWLYFLARDTMQTTGRIAWQATARGLWLADDRVVGLSDLLEETAFDGSPIHRTKLLWGDQLGLYDAVRLNGKTVVGGYWTYPHIPTGYEPFAFVQSIPDDGYGEPRGDARLRSIEKSNILAFHIRRSKIPVISGTRIALPLQRAIAVVSDELHIQRLIELDGDVVWLSAGVDGTMHAIVQTDTARMLYGVTTDGILVYTTRIPDAAGRPLYPPFLCSGGMPMFVGEKSIVACDTTGGVRWTYNVPPFRTGPALSVLHGDTLAIRTGPYLIVLDNDGNRQALVDGLNDTPSTPALLMPDGRFLCGGKKGLQLVTFT